MVTNEQNLLNLGSAAQLTAINLGLDQLAASDYSQEQRISFIMSLAGTIIAYPDEFTPDTITSAQYVLGQSVNGLTLGNYVRESADGSATLANTFVNSLGDNILGLAQSPADLGVGVANLMGKTGLVLANLGTVGVQASATASYGWVVPVAVIAFLALAIATGARETRRAITG